MIDSVKAWDVKVGDKVSVTPERPHFVFVTAIDFHYPGGQHFGQSEDATVRIDVGWGASYHAPEDVVQVIRIATADEFIASVFESVIA